MLHRKRCIIYLLFLFLPTVASHGASDTTESKNIKQYLHILWLQEDLDEYLRKKCHKNKLLQKLISLIFIEPHILRQPKQQPLFLIYEGKKIGNIQLSRRGIFDPKKNLWTRAISIVIPKTRHWVIKEQLHFKKDDRLSAQKLTNSQHRLDKLPFLSKSNFTIHKNSNYKDTVNVHVTTQDQFPITPSIDMAEMKLFITHNNLMGWGHKLEGQFSYNHRLEHGYTYQATNIKRSGITSKLQYFDGQKKGIVGLKIFRAFNEKNKYAGQIDVSYVRKEKERFLDGFTNLQVTPWSYYDQKFWLGRTFELPQNDHQAKIFLIGSATCKYFEKRPRVMASGQFRNAFFHHNRLFLTGTIGFRLLKRYKNQPIGTLGTVEYIPCGNKIMLTGGYQRGEFVDRPYLRIDITQGRHINRIGHLYSNINIGGFSHKQSIEQGIINLHLGYNTPLLTLGKKSFRQLIKLKYLAGFNMFTGELISTNEYKVAADFKDPFVGGTKRIQLTSETTIFTSKRLLGCKTAALGFVEAVQLQDDQNRVRQSVLCKALGIGLMLAPPRFIFDALQVKLRYYPIVDDIGWEVGGRVACEFGDFCVGGPSTIPFVEH